MIPVSANGYLSPTAYQLQEHACVLPCGGLLNEAPLLWTDEKLKYYTHYVVNHQPIDRLFNGFIFKGVQTRASHFIDPLYAGLGDPADLTDWLQWLQALFAPEANLHALARLAGDRKPDVWITLPYPHPSQSHFGVIQGRMPNFQTDEDRVMAMLWWADQLLARWKTDVALQKRLQLRGFVWPKEMLDEDDARIVPQVNTGIKARGLLSMWLPNYGAAHVIEWRELGFDVAVLYSNYTGHSSFERPWLTNAAMFAKTLHTGIQIVWGTGQMYNQTHPLDYFNLGLPEAADYMQQAYQVFQFPNRTLDALYTDRFTDYIQLYLFLKGLYQKNDYPGIAY